MVGVWCMGIRSCVEITPDGARLEERVTSRGNRGHSISKDTDSHQHVETSQTTQSEHRRQEGVVVIDRPLTLLSL